MDRYNHIDDDSNRITKHWMFLLLCFVSFVLLFGSLGSRELWGSEGRWAEITREMFLSVDFFNPQIGGKPYFDKPPLTYWLIAGVSAITGTLNEWVVRLPSAIFGFITIIATVALGKRLWSARVGLLAGWLLLTSYGLLFWSRTASADTENLAAITLCILWYWVRRDRPNFITFLIFYLIAFLGALTKGLTAVAVPVVVVLSDIVIEKRWKVLLRPPHFLALAVAIGVYLSPFAYAAMTRPLDYHSSGLAKVFQENVLRYFRPFDHKNPFYTYIYAVPMLVLPWAPLLVAGVIGSLFSWKGLDKKTRWLMVSIGMIFLFFTLSGSRRAYYILPITPFCVLLIAVFLVHITDDRTNKARYEGMNIQKYVFLGFILFEIALPFVLLIMKARNDFEFFVSLSISGIVMGLLALISRLVLQKSALKKLFISENTQQMAVMITPAVIMFGGFFLWQQVIIDNFRTECAFIEKVKVKARSENLHAANIGMFPNDAKLLFYLDMSKPVQILQTTSDWDRFLSEKGSRLLLTQRRYESKALSSHTRLLQRQPDMAERVNFWDSANAQKKKWAAWFLNNNAQENTISADYELGKNEN